MTEVEVRRIPIRAGFFTIPDDPNESPRLLGSKCSACGESFFPRREICRHPLHLSPGSTFRSSKLPVTHVENVSATGVAAFREAAWAVASGRCRVASISA